MYRKARAGAARRAVLVAALLLAVPASGQAQGSAAPPVGAAMNSAGTAPDPRDQRIEELQKLVEQLLKRVADLERRSDPPSTPPPPPPPPTPVPAAPGATGQTGSATLLPNISAVGNLIFGAGDSRRVPNRGRFNFSEFELAFQDAVTPRLRYDVFLAAAKDEGWGVGMEEGYLTATALLPGLNARIGRIRTPIGRFNPQHPHTWPFITQPSVITAMFGPEGLSSDGAVLEYLLPVRGLFARAEVGAWQTVSEAEDGLGFGAGESGAYSGRLRIGKELSRDKELELGFSRYQGNGRVAGGNRQRSLTGLDLTYRSYMPGGRSLTLAGEVYNHQTRIVGAEHDVLGGFAYLAYRLSKYWETGVRGDYTRFPYPSGGEDYGGSLFLTKYLNEQTSLRLEYQHTRSEQLGSGNGIYFQILFGSGPHTHALK